jgi:aspartate aminotransferase-like enzyme
MVFSEKHVMIPGPTPVVKEIRDQMAREIQAFGDPRFVADFKAVIDRLGALLNGAGTTFVVAGSGTLAMEMAIANTTARGDRLLVVSHGFFGDRFIEIGQRKGLQVDVLQSPWGQQVSLDQIEQQLGQHDYAAVTVTHVDTSTGVVAPVEAIGQLMTSYPHTLYIVDGVCATAAEFEDVQAMNIDVLFTGSQKAFGVCPGLMMLWAGPRALARRQSLGETIPEYYCDFHKWGPVMDDPAKYFATPAVNLVWSLAASLDLIEREGGLPARDARHRANARAMQAGLEALGFHILAQPHCRAVTLSVVIYPEGVADLAFRQTLADEGVVVAGALADWAGRAFRLGHMGNIDTAVEVAVLGAIERTLHRLGHRVTFGSGVGAYLSALG